MRAGLPWVWDGWAWASGSLQLTHSRLSSLILRKEGLREMMEGLLVFAWTTWHLVERGGIGRYFHLVSSVLFEIGQQAGRCYFL